MEIGTTITAVLLIAVCILPFLLTGRSRKNKEKLLFQSLKNLADQQNCKITQHEICEEYILGIDETKSNLFFYKRINDKEISKQINLAEFRSCKIINTSRSNGNEKIIDKLELSFSSISKGSNISLELYNSDERIHLSDDFLLIERWTKKLNEILNLKNQHSRQPV